MLSVEKRLCWEPSTLVTRDRRNWMTLEWEKNPTGNALCWEMLHVRMQLQMMSQCCVILTQHLRFLVFWYYFVLWFMFWFTSCAILIIIIICFSGIVVNSLVLRSRFRAPSVQCLVHASVPVLVPHLYVPSVVVLSSCLWLHVCACLSYFLFYFDSLVCFVSMFSLVLPN